MRFSKKFFIAALLLPLLASPPAQAGSTTVIAPAVSNDTSPTDTFDPNFPHRHFLLCDLISSALIETAPGQPIVFGDRHIVSKFTLNDKPPSWFETSYLDFARAFPQVWQDLQKSGRHWGQDYKIRAASVDVSGDGHKEMLYQIIDLNGAPQGRIYVSDDKTNGFITRIFDTLQPTDVISYNGSPYVISRANGSVYVYRLYPNPVKTSSKSISNIIVSQACIVADLAPQQQAPVVPPQ